MCLSADKSLNIYAFTGLGTDARIFEYLNVDANIHSIPWKLPRRRESMESYVKFLLEDVQLQQPYAFVGVSFGGMLAAVATHIFQPKFSVLVASLKSYRELPQWMRYSGALWLPHVLPSRVYKPKMERLNRFLGLKNPAHFQIFKSSYEAQSPLFYKRCIRLICRWRSGYKEGSNLLHIHGDRDTLFPLKKISEPRISVRGGHFIIISAAKQISSIINAEIQKHSQE